MAARILFLVANPSDETKLELEKEYKEVYTALAESEYGEVFHLAYYPEPPPVDLVKLLLDARPAILHFSGHGSPQNELLFVSDDGEAQPVTANALSSVMGSLDEPVRLAVLNACFSEGQADAITESVDFVIGIEDAITDAAATAFSTTLYRSLAEGCSVEAAFGLGTAQLELLGLPEEHKPRLLHRDGVEPANVFFAKEYEREPTDDAEPHGVASDSSFAITFQVPVLGSDESAKAEKGVLASVDPGTPAPCPIPDLVGEWETTWGGSEPYRVRTTWSTEENKYENTLSRVNERLAILGFSVGEVTSRWSPTDEPDIWCFELKWRFGVGLPEEWRSQPLRLSDFHYSHDEVRGPGYVATRVS